MEPLAIIAGAAVFAWLVRQKPQKPEAPQMSQKIRPQMSQKRRAPKIKAKRSIVIIEAPQETKARPQMYRRELMFYPYCAPFNPAWINTAAHFAGDR